MHESIELSNPCEFIELTPINPLISKCQIKVCYVGQMPNRNRSVITKEVAIQMANSLPGSPIVGFYNEETGDFEEHNREVYFEDGQLKLKDTTRPYGFVDLNAKCWFQKFLDDGIEHEYLMTEGYLWTGQYPEAKRVIEKGNNQSMELKEDLTRAQWAKIDNLQGKFFIINETVISKLCILGEDYEPCFEGASIEKLSFSLDKDFSDKIYNLMEEITKYLKEGGETMDEEKVVTEVTEAETADVEPVAASEESTEPGVVEKEVVIEEEPTEDTVTEEESVAQYNLEEIPEYTELLTNYNSIVTERDNLQNQIHSLETQVTELLAFKNSIDRKNKQAMIDSFYMLSDDDKKDVIANIDTYSIDDIEAKLSVICVRNKVNFNLDDDKEEKASLTFNLDDTSNEDASTPAWVKAVLDNSKNKI